MAAKKPKISSTKASKAAVGIGVGVTAAMLTAAGAYFLYGSKNAAKNRKQVKSWMLKAKAEVLEGLEGTKIVSKEHYDKLVDAAVAGYGRVKSISGPELESLRREMKSHWKVLEQKGIVKETPAPKAAPKKRSTAGAKKKTT